MLNNYDVLILCGGLGKRLRSVIGETQKVMASVSGRPFLVLNLRHLKRQGFKRIILCTGYQSDQVQRYFKDKTKRKESVDGS